RLRGRTDRDLRRGMPPRAAIPGGLRSSSPRSARSACGRTRRGCSTTGPSSRERTRIDARTSSTRGSTSRLGHRSRSPSRSRPHDLPLLSEAKQPDRDIDGSLAPRWLARNLLHDELREAIDLLTQALAFSLDRRAENPSFSDEFVTRDRV